MDIFLRSWACERTGLADALATCAGLLGDGAVAILMAPAELRIGRPHPDGVHLRDGSPARLEDVYEARAFGANAELRWSASNAEHGYAVLLSETDAAPAGWHGLEGLSPVSTITETALLWGVCDEVHDGWSALRERRVPQIEVPVELEVGERAVLESIAYLGVVDEHGNVRVVEERAAGLRAERTTDLHGGQT